MTTAKHRTTNTLAGTTKAGKAKFKVDQGVWKLSVTADTVTSEVVYGDNLMYANSGAVYVNDTIVTVYSRESDDDATKMEFKVRWWKAADGELIREATFPKEANLESRGMSYNPADRKVYGLFYLTDVALPCPPTNSTPRMFSRATPLMPAMHWPLST